MVAKKRGKKRTGNPARSRFVIGRGGGGAFGRYISVLEWCSVAPTVVYSVSFGQHIRKNMRASLPFSQSAKSVGIGMEFETLEFFFFFVSSFIVFTFRLYFSSTLCTLRRSIDHPSRYLFFFFVFPSAVCFSICLFIRYSSFHYCFLSFFSFRFANPFFVAIFYKILHCISHGIFFDQKKEKHGWKEDLFDDIWRGNFSVDAGKPAMNSNQGPRLGPHSTSRIPILKLVTPPRSAPMRSFSPLILSAFLIFDSIFFSERKGRKI